MVKRSRKILRVTLLHLIMTTFGISLFLRAAPAAAQQTTSPETHTGSITGHAICSDTRQPARFATITLQKVEGGTNEGPNIRGGEPYSEPTYAATTDLHGSFTVPSVLPGRYYVTSVLPGYISQVNTSSATGPLDPDLIEAQKKLQASLPTVEVTEGVTSSITLELQHGASISGTVRYDDGTPASLTSVLAITKTPKGQWADARMPAVMLPFVLPSIADDRGRFHLSALPPGEYTLQVTLPEAVIILSGYDASNLAAIAARATAPKLYYGNTLRPSTAKSINLRAGDQLEGLDIEIPTMGLRDIQGTVIDAADGQPVLLGTVALFDTRDNSLLETAFVGGGVFGFTGIPDGAYLLELSVFDGKRGSRKSYAKYDLPLVVQGSDIRNLVLKPVPAPPKTATQAP